MLIKLNYNTSASNYYLVIYWGNKEIVNNNFTQYLNNYYTGTQSFINNISSNTTSVVNKILTDFSGRKNFWSNTIDLKSQFKINSYIDNNAWLWSINRINAKIIDGQPSFSSQPTRYPVRKDVSYDLPNVINDNIKLVFQLNSEGFNGTENTQQIKAYDYQITNTTHCQIILINDENNYIPVFSAEFHYNPKKKNLNSRPYSLVKLNNITQSAFQKKIEDPILIKHFYANSVESKRQFFNYQNLILQYLNTLDNFVANLFFGVNFNDVSGYFAGSSLEISKKVLKSFSQPNSFDTIPSLQLDKYESEAIFNSINIVPSTTYCTFDKGVLSYNTTHKLPSGTAFEIYKPTSFTCNGLDIYNQGQGFSNDYTLKFYFEYNNQNVLEKELFLTASKYFITQNEYEQRLLNNLETTPYYYISNPDSGDTSPISATKYNEFRLFGYSGMIPDLKDNASVLLTNRAFSPKDNTKYTKEEYIEFLKSQGIVDEEDINNAILDYLESGNSFYVIDLNKHSNQYVKLKNIDIGVTQYTENSPVYWTRPKSKSLSSASLTDQGFRELSAVINGGFVTSLSAPPYTITNVEVGSNSVIESLNIISLGSGIVPGYYESFIKPSPSETSVEQPGLISFTVLPNGRINSESISIRNSGSNFSFGFTTTIGNVIFNPSAVATSYPQLRVVVSNVSKFTITTDSNGLIASMTQTELPSEGFNYSFKFNPKSLVGLGYTSDANIDIIYNGFSQVDSFFIASSGLNPGQLEDYTLYNDENKIINEISFTDDTEELVVIDSEIINQIPKPSENVSPNQISIICRVIPKNNLNFSGTLQINIYQKDNNELIKVFSSDIIEVNEGFINYNNIHINISGIQFLSNFEYYYVGISQNISNGVLVVKGKQYSEKSFDFELSSEYVNDQILPIYGGYSTNSQQGLDLFYNPVIKNIGLGTIFGNNTNSVFVGMFKTNNDILGELSISLSTSFGLYLSNKILINALSSNVSNVNFSLSTTLSAGTIFTSANIISNPSLLPDNVFISRDMSRYNYSNLGMSTESNLIIQGQRVPFNFIFYKIFRRLSTKIYAGFNYNDRILTLPQENDKRQILPTIQIDGSWGYSGDIINVPVSIYPRSMVSRFSTISSNLPLYNYVDYDHDIYLTIGFQSSNVSYVEKVYLQATPKWTATWMNRQLSDYKNTNIYNVLQKSVIEKVNYFIGSPSTNIGVNGEPKLAIFEGTFLPQGSTSTSLPIMVSIGSYSGVQFFINNQNTPIIDSFNTISSSDSTFYTSISSTLRTESIYFKAFYYTLSTAVIDINWNVGFGYTSIDINSSQNFSASPVAINSNIPIQRINFINISKTSSEQDSLNYGFPIGDSFVIRSI